MPTNSLAQGLVLFVPMDRFTGWSAYDITRLTNVSPFTIAGATWSRQGVPSFDGTNTAKVVLTKASCLNLETSPCTVSVWCKRTGSGNRYILSDLNSAANMYGAIGNLSMTTGKFIMGWNNATLLTSVKGEVSGVWNHVVWTRTGVTGAWTARIYINGVLDGSTTTALNPQPQASNGTLSIGTPGDYTGGTAFHYNGEIKHVMVWNRGITGEEVKQLFLLQSNLTY